MAQVLLQLAQQFRVGRNEEREQLDFLPEDVTQLARDVHELRHVFVAEAALEDRQPARDLLVAVPIAEPHAQRLDEAREAGAGLFQRP